MRNFATEIVKKGMIPKIIHLCWFSKESYPLEIKACIETWQKLLPDYRIRHWSYDEAKAIGCQFIDEALANHKWAFAADAVRFYAVYTEGGVYMDSDIYLFRRFDEIIPDSGCVTVNEYMPEHDGHASLQAAFFMGEKGNRFCKQMFDYYSTQHFENPDGTLNQTISPYIMALLAEEYGYVDDNTEQHLEGLTVYPTHYLLPRKRAKRTEESIGVHCIYGSWRDRKFGRRVELAVKRTWHGLKYLFSGKYF
ncbi:MAG: glycosyltransferase [Prevotella sp.]|nr:glycosyltransferase [Prevotella sp.]